jgi:hypothetical protein
MWVAASDLAKVAVQPTKGKLEVGGAGVDRRGTYDVIAISGPTITYRYTDGEMAGKEFTGELAQKQLTHNNIMAERTRATTPQKLPGFLSIDEITWDNRGVMAWFIGWLAGGVHFYLETKESNVDRVVNQYRKLTGQIITPETRGAFNVIPDINKFGSKCEIKFRPTDTIPDSLGSEQRVPGVISRYGLFWALVRLGFTLEGPQDPTKIRQSIPESQRMYFDQGLAGQPLAQPTAAGQ